jgi:DNA-binding transcriptional LysR family regulator
MPRASIAPASMRMDWDKLRVFHAVADAGSFTHAGEVLNLSQSAVSRQIHSLEESLGLLLFHRHARGLIMTESGELLYRTVHDVFHRLAMAEAQLTESKEQPQGPLKISTTTAFGSTWLTPQMKEFVDLYPEIDVSLVLTENDLDLGMREADCAIRFYPPTQPDLIQRHLKTVRSRLFASPSYIKQHGMPKTVDDLDGHIIIYGQDGPLPAASINWLLDPQVAENSLKPVLRVNNIYALYRAVVSGLGIASLPTYMARLSNEIVNVLPQLEGPALDVYFIYPEEMRNSKRISVFRDFLVRKIAERRMDF